MEIPNNGKNLEYHLRLILNNGYPGEYYEGVVLGLKKGNFRFSVKVSYCYERGSFYAQIVRVDGGQYEYSCCVCSDLETADKLRMHIAETLHMTTASVIGVKPESPSVSTLPALFVVTEIDEVRSTYLY